MNELINRYFVVRGEELSPVQELSTEGLPYYEIRKYPMTGEERDIESYIKEANKYLDDKLVFVKVTFAADIESGKKAGYFRFCLVRE